MQIETGLNQDPSTTERLDFEQRIAELDQQIAELQRVSSTKGIDYSVEIRQLHQERANELRRIYSGLTPWQTVQVARHPARPLLRDYIDLMVKDFRELHGDRCFGDDRAIVTGIGQIAYHKVMIVGHNKGRSVKEKVTCNFGCAHPEGYRKALHKMCLAEKFGLPIVTFIDTPGAYPGVGAEERGQAQAIAVNLFKMMTLRVPIICICIAEGGSGGALGIAVGDRLAMLQHAYFSVISPEGCAAILWRDGTAAPEAAKALRLTSTDLLKLGLIDAIIPEPVGGAHRNVHDTVHNVERYVTKTLDQLQRMDLDRLLQQRCERWRLRGTQFVANLPAKPEIPIRPAKEKTGRRKKATAIKV